MNLWLPMSLGKSDGPKGTQGDWRADWQADWGRSLWSLANAGAYCRGFSSGLTPAPALEMQAGTTGQAWAIPVLSSQGPLEFPEFQAGSS